MQSIHIYYIKVKAKSNKLQKRVQGVLISLFQALSRRWRTTSVCDAWPVRRQTYSYCYIPKLQGSLPIGWYKIILLGDRDTCVLTTCPGLHLTGGWLGFEPATY